MVRFRLEPLLKYRKLQENLLEKALAAARRQLDVAEVKLTDCYHRHGEAVREFMNKQTRGGLSGAAAEIYGVYLSQLEDDSRRQKEHIEKIQRQIVQKRDQLLEAVKKRKTLDKLKEKQRQQSIEAEHRNERHFFDDVAANTFIRKSIQHE